MHTSPSIAIVLPAFNEATTIEATILSFSQSVPQAKIYVINNCSTDKTEDIARNALSQLPIPGKLINEVRKGKGNALRAAFSIIDADVYLLADADMTYPANRALDLLAPILNDQADMVVGDRHSGGQYSKENKRLLHGFGNSLVQWLINFLFRAHLVDVMSGYRAFSKAFVKSYPILVEGFQVETDMTLHALDKRFRILEIPVEYQDRPSDSFSKLNTFSDGAKVLFTITQIYRYYRPLTFFASLATIFSIAGICASIPVINDWLLYRYIYHVPLAILATGLEIFALMLLGIGLILDSLNHYQKMDYERTLLNSHISSGKH